MSRKKLLSILVIALIMPACGIRVSPVASSSASVTNTPTAAIIETSISSFNITPVASTTNTPLPPALPFLASPALARIDFLDEKNGWAIAVNAGGHMLRTVDGGATWLDATPPGIATIGFSTGFFVLNSDAVWVLAPSTDFFFGTLYRTSDGGITWNSNPVPFGSGFLQFLDLSTGRLLADRGAGAGSQAVELFQTSDGGATWTSVFHNDSSQPGASDSLPLGGIKNGMTFLNAEDGWVTGSIPADGVVYLYVTRDGGVSWSQQSVHLPLGYANYQYMAQAPAFLGKAGFLPVVIYLPDSTGLTFFSTHDGGLSWSGDPSDARKWIKPGLSTFADALHGWSWDGGTHLYFSDDGARTWQDIIPTLDLSGRLAQLEFVPAAAGGFTGWALTRENKTGNSQLYRTSDGENWNLLIP